MPDVHSCSPVCCCLSLTLSGDSRALEPSPRKHATEQTVIDMLGSKEKGAISQVWAEQKELKGKVTMRTDINHARVHSEMCGFLRTLSVAPQLKRL